YYVARVMIAKGGHKVIEDNVTDSIKTELLPLSTLITPNIPEAEVLTGLEIESKEDMVKAANHLKNFGATNVVIKGGHRDSNYSDDYVLLEDESFWLSGKRIGMNRKHGT